MLCEVLQQNCDHRVIASAYSLDDPLHQLMCGHRTGRGPTTVVQSDSRAGYGLCRAEARRVGSSRRWASRSHSRSSVPGTIQPVVAQRAASSSKIGTPIGNDGHESGSDPLSAEL